MNRVIMLKSGNTRRFITVKVIESDPVALANAKPEEIWTTFDGKSNSGKTTYTRPVLIRDMDVQWLKNAMKILLKRCEVELKTVDPVALAILDRGEVLVDYAIKTIPQFVVMQRELRRKLVETKEEEPPKTGRKFDLSL